MTCCLPDLVGAWLVRGASAEVLQSDLPAAIIPVTCGERSGVMSAVVIGVDPHKASHTAVAVDGRELPLGDVRVRASAVQTGRLLAWA